MSCRVSCLACLPQTSKLTWYPPTLPPRDPPHPPRPPPQKRRACCVGRRWVDALQVGRLIHGAPWPRRRDKHDCDQVCTQECQLPSQLPRADCQPGATRGVPGRCYVAGRRHVCLGERAVVEEEKLATLHCSTRPNYRTRTRPLRRSCIPPAICSAHIPGNRAVASPPDTPPCTSRRRPCLACPGRLVSSRPWPALPRPRPRRRSVKSSPRATRLASAACSPLGLRSVGCVWWGGGEQGFS